MQRIEVLTTFDSHDPVFRAKILGLRHALADTHQFADFSPDTNCQAVLLRVRLDRKIAPESLEILRKKSKATQIHLFVPDFEPIHLPGLMSLKDIVDVYLVPTPELQMLLRFSVPGTVACLPDPIDMGLMASNTRVHSGPLPSAPLRLAWFGFADSYNKSMRALQYVFDDLAAQGLATLTTFTESGQEGPVSYGYLKQYKPQNILQQLEQHDVVVLSHLAMDFSVNTHCKSENKAVLAINRGLPVIASKTPAYSRLLERFGLGDYLFDSKETLFSAVERLRMPKARNDYLQRCQSNITAEYNHIEISRQWLQILKSSTSLQANAHA